MWCIKFHFEYILWSIVSFGNLIFLFSFFVIDDDSSKIEYLRLFILNYGTKKIKRINLSLRNETLRPIFKALQKPLSNDTSIRKKFYKRISNVLKWHRIEFFVFMFFFLLLIIKIKKMKNRPVVRKCARWKRDIYLREIQNVAKRKQLWSA